MRLVKCSSVAAIAVAWFLPGPAKANSDGYYCVGPNYVAYQFGLGGAHRLTVLKLDGAVGIRTAGVLELPQFQVHGIECGRGWIELAAFDAVYHVALNLEYRPTAYEVRPFPAGQIPTEFISSQLNSLGGMAGGRAYLDPIRAHVGQTSDDSAFFLEVTATVVSPANTCELNVKSRIVQIASDGRELAEMVVFEGRGHRECGE